MERFLKILSIFHIISDIAKSITTPRAPVKDEVVALANDAIDVAITKGHLPTDFKTDIGTLVEDIATMHPGVKNAA